jgi:hypothetical protein
MQCLYCQKTFQYKRDRVMNHFGYNAKLILVVCPKIPPALKEKFITCNNVVPPRMSAMELWDTGGPPVSAGPTRSSQSTQNNVAGASTLPIDVPASEPPESSEHSRAASDQSRSSTLRQRHMSEAYHTTRGWLLYERGAGSGEQGFLILIFKNSDNHGEGDLLLWIMKLWIF